MKLKRYLILPTILLLGVAASCTPNEIAVFSFLTPPQQNQVIHSIRTKQASSDCYQAIAKHWPASSQSWARSIVWRESRNNPTAQNRSSSAAGCFQMTRVHAGRFQRLGYSWANDRYNADANTRVAFDLYREAGARPWSL